ncbi:ABC transporter permease [Akkermansiaceae bacterium]|nr:ABC transporter permease [Akkermansiaceae bacterium]
MRKVKEAGKSPRPWRVKPELPFVLFLTVVLVAYVGMLLLMVGANVLTVTWGDLGKILKDDDILRSIKLTVVTCTATAILSVLVAVPLAYLLSRYQFRGRAFIDTLLDIPILLPPLIVGLSLLILFNRVSPATCCWMMAGGLLLAALVGFALRGKGGGRALVPGALVVFAVMFGIGAVMMRGSGSLEEVSSGMGFPMTFHPLGIVLAQFPVAAAFAVRTMRTTFDQISPRYEEVAMTLGCHRGQAFSRVVLPLAVKGMVAAGTMAWARALGEFGPVLIFAGATKGRTEVLATSVFLEINIGNLPGAAAISLLMIVIAVVTLLLVRFFVGRGGAI